MTILLAIFVFGLLILMHELGHFIVAKWVGIKVYEFAIGMGPAIISKEQGGTKYSLRLFPIGGFNKMAGMEPGDEDNPCGFNRKSLFQRTAVIASGSIMNILLALVLFIFVFAVLGVPSQVNIVGEVIANSPAAEAGIQSGDKISAIDGMPIETWNQMVDIIHDNPGETLSLTIMRDDTQFVVQTEPVLDAENNVGLIGIKQSRQRSGFFQAIALGVRNTVAITVAIFSGLVQMITGKIPAEVAGPVGIVSILGNVAQFGLANILNFMALLSLNLGLFNLLPIPALDGSRLVFLGIEGLRGRPVEPQKENLVHLIGFALLIGLMLFITYQDILRLLG